MSFGNASRPRKQREATGVTEFRNQVLFVAVNLLIIGYIVTHLVS